VSYRGIHPPEPWREEQLCYGNGHRRHGDLYANQGGTEFGWGAGLIAPMNNGAPPGPGGNPGLAAARAGGGQHMPKAPRVVPPCGGVGKPIERPRPSHEVRGYPGEQIAR
jgi:hypothetical protein